jgi:CHASE2 domain-containing sensor protein
MAGAESIAKVVRLEFTSGDFEQGFRVNLTLGEEGKSSILKETGSLPPLPALPRQYQLWRDSYRGSGLLTRIKAVPIEGNISLDACQKQAKVLCDQFNQWLRAESFREIQHKLRTYLSPTDTVRLILDVDDDQIQKLPWQLWNFFEDFPNAEIAIAAPNTQIPTGLASNPAVEVRILVVLGDSQGINVEEDRAFLENFPGAEFLVEPDHKTLQNMLCDGPWDILYFAGHSSSESGNQTGRIYINRRESLTIEEISHPLKTAIAKGLQIAIFNSCDGLRLARSLGHLQIPQTIFMREPVPDEVAQEFLKYFLTAFASGESFYQAVRSARLQLQHLEKNYPCATWLPVIYQNAVMIPPRWKDLQLAPVIPGEDLPVVRSKKLGLFGALVCSGVVAIAVGWVRHQGWLQAWELQAYDHVMQVRSLVQVDPVDSKVLVITIGDEDKAAYGEKNKGGDLSITSNNLLILMKKLQQAKAKVVGLDLIRDPQGLPSQVVQQMQHIPNVVAGCGNPTPAYPAGFKPPQGLDQSIGFVDTAEDFPGGPIRRQLLSLPLYEKSPCQSEWSFGLSLAANYLNLAPEEIEKRLPIMDGASHPGVYQQQRERESLSPQDFRHVIINYRNSKIPQMSLGNFMKDRAGQLNLEDKIVLVGITRSDSKDRSSTTLAKDVFGVLIQAEQTSHLVSLVLRERSPIWVWPEWGDWLWIGSWSVMGGLIVWRGRSQFVVMICMVSGVIVIYAIGCLVLINMTGWIPIIPPLLSLLLTIACLSVFEQIQPKISPSKL